MRHALEDSPRSGAPGGSPHVTTVRVDRRRRCVIRGSHGRPRADARTCAVWSTRVVVAAFGGWSDAGNAASAAVEHLEPRRTGRSSVFALDPDDFYDFQVNRPQRARRRRGARDHWPTTELRIAQLPDGRDLVLVLGLEPNLRWRQFGTLIASALRSARPTRVLLLGSLLADTPHTRPVPVSTTSRDPAADDRAGLAPSTYEGPTGHRRRAGRHAGPRGLPTVSMLWPPIPHYVSHPPCPKATLALLTALEELLDVAARLGRAARAGPSVGARGRRAGRRGLRGGRVRRPRWRSSRTPPSCPRRAATRSPPSSSATCVGAKGLISALDRQDRGM